MAYFVHVFVKISEGCNLWKASWPWLWKILVFMRTRCQQQQDHKFLSWLVLGKYHECPAQSSRRCTSVSRSSKQPCRDAVKSTHINRKQSYQCLLSGTRPESIPCDKQHSLLLS